MPTFSGSVLTTGIVNGYCTLADLRSAIVLNYPAATTTDDSFLSDIITSVSRSIDLQCGRYFYKSAAHEVRYFTASNHERLLTGDLVSVTALYTDNLSGDRTYPFTWSTTDYDLWPYDAATYSEPDPYRYIDITPQGIYQFPINVARGVKLDAVFGWPAVPTAIAKACLLWSARTYKRFQTPLGISATTALGEMQVKVPPPDPDVDALINNYRLAAV